MESSRRVSILTNKDKDKDQIEPDSNKFRMDYINYREIMEMWDKTLKAMEQLYSTGPPVPGKTAIPEWTPSPPPKELFAAAAAIAEGFGRPPLSMTSPPSHTTKDKIINVLREMKRNISILEHLVEEL